MRTVCGRDPGGRQRDIVTTPKTPIFEQAGFFDRRHLLLTAAACAGLAACSKAGGNQAVRIGYLKEGALIIARHHDDFSKSLKDAGVGRIDWAEFPSGPPVLEALSANAIDFGATGDTPPIFAQSAGAQFSYVAAVPVTGKQYAILVPGDSAIKTVGDLKGKRVAFTRGSTVHYLVIAALKQAGLALSDITPVNLPPPDGRAAFDRGDVDAWAIWDPFFAAVQKASDVRVLTTAEPFGPGATFFFATNDFIRRDPDSLKATLNSLRQTSRWIEAHRDEAALLVSQSTGMSVEVMKLAMSRIPYDVVPIAPWIVAHQQKIADTFAGLGIIPRTITVQDAVSSINWT